jgi:hypothetical protein
VKLFRTPGRSLGRTLAVGLTLALVAAACGDDDEDAAAATAAPETGAEFLVRAQGECQGSDPGFDTFYGEHPEPTAADYAAFLPRPRDMVAELADCIGASNPPADLADEVAAVVAAMEVVVDDLDAAIEAAEAGDLDGTNRWVGQMHDVDQPKIDVAFAAVQAAVEGQGK